MHDLTKAVDAILSESLPQSLRNSIDAALAAGATPREVLGLVKRQCGGKRGPTVLATEAYLGIKQEG